MEPTSRPVVLTKTVSSRSWSLRSMAMGPSWRRRLTTFASGTARPSAFTTGMVQEAAHIEGVLPRPRRTTIGTSVSTSRKIPAWVPATRVRSRLVTCSTVRLSSATRRRSTTTRSSGTPASWLNCTSVTPGASRTSSRIRPASCRPVFKS